MYTWTHACNIQYPCKAKEDVKKFLTALSAKMTTLASWVVQLDGPCSERVQKSLVSY